ncbi:MAG: VgrG-related protein, partial [Chloroflexota bacterium]
MTHNAEAVPHAKVLLNGTPLDAATAADVMEVEIQQHMCLPDSFLLHILDNGFNRLKDDKFKVGDELTFVSETTDYEEIELLIGEITTIEPQFTEAKEFRLVLRGYDKLHRLYRTYQTKAHQNVRDSDIAAALADELGLDHEIEQTETIYDHLIQFNESDLHFLQRRADRIGFVAFVTNTTLHFHSPNYESAKTSLKWGDTLLSFYPILSTSAQVEEVQVRDWDMEAQKPILGRAEAGTLYPKIEGYENGAETASPFGKHKRLFTESHAQNQAEADLIASARLNEISGQFIEADGMAFQMPELRAGSVVEIFTGSKKFDGDYLVTATEHTYSPGGYYTRFSITGLHSNLLLNQLTLRDHLVERDGVAIGIVTNTKDPQKLGRVKVAYPWLSDDLESHWCRVVSVGAGPKAGFSAVPAVEDEVLVAFEHGQINRPYVLGGVWNGKHGLPLGHEGVREGDEPHARSWTSRKGHQITLFETEEQRIEIQTVDGHAFTLDDTGKSIELRTAGGLVLKMSDNENGISIESSGSVTIKGQQEINIESGGSMTLSASGDLNLSG